MTNMANKKRKDGRYRTKVTLPNGKKKDVYGRTVQELKKKKEELLLQYALGATAVDNRITVQDWAEKWWNATKNKPVRKNKPMGYKTMAGYISAMNNYIFPFMGNMKLVDVKPIHIQQLINEMGKQGKSTTLQRSVLTTFNKMFVYAIKNGLTHNNPALYVELYEVPAKQRDALTPAQIQTLLEVCKGLRAEMAIHLALYCGLRRGEIAALKWTDIDEKYRVLVITRAVEFVRNRPFEKEPKTQAGNRLIPIPPHLWDMLQATPRKSIYVVPSASGKQMSEFAVRRLMEPVQRRLDKLGGDGFKVTLQMLRHTYATILDLMGLPPKICQYLLGHAEVATTKNIYTHFQDEHLYIAANRLGDIYETSITSRGSGGGQTVQLIPRRESNVGG